MASAASSYTLTFIEGSPDEYVVHRYLPDFTTFKFPVYKFLPNTKTNVGLFTIQGQLWSTEKITSFQISVTVSNKAPYLATGEIPD